MRVTATNAAELVAVFVDMKERGIPLASVKLIAYPKAAGS